MYTSPPTTIARALRSSQLVCAAVLAAGGVLIATTQAIARQQIEVLDACIQVESSGRDSPLEIINNCSVRVHASWGAYNRAKDSGVISYTKDLDPGERVLSGYTAGEDFYALGCPATSTPAHPRGYKLAYRSDLARAVGTWEHVGSLVCVES